MFKKIGKFIKRGLKKVGKFIKRGFKKLGKFVGKLGPVGMLGMMIMMPQLGSWWKQFGDWAGTLQGPMTGVMESIHWAGSKVGEAYSSITETISNGFKKIPGVGEAYEGLEEYIGGKLDEVRGALGLEQSAMAPASSETVSEVDSKIELEKIKSQTAPTTGEENIFGGNMEVNPDGTLKLDPMDEFRSMMASPSNTDIMVDQGSLLGKDFGTEYYSGKNTGATTTTTTTATDTNKEFLADDSGKIADAKANPTGKETWIDKAKGIYEGVSAVTGTIEEIFGDDEQPAIGGTYVADNMVGLMDTNKAAQIDYAANGFAGQANWGMGNSDYYNSILQAIMNRDDAYERFRPPSIRGT